MTYITVLAEEETFSSIFDNITRIFIHIYAKKALLVKK